MGQLTHERSIPEWYEWLYDKHQNHMDENFELIVFYAPCPACKAKPGELCVSRGEVAKRFHTSRSDRGSTMFFKLMKAHLKLESTSSEITDELVWGIRKRGIRS